MSIDAVAAVRSNPAPSPSPSARWPGGASATLAALALWLLATAWLRPLLLPDEGRYGNVARDMLLGVGAPTLAEGRGWVPLLNGLPFFHKPPLAYWLDMAAMAVIGVNPLSARFAALVGAWTMGAALFLAWRRWHGVAAARLALTVLASSPFFFVAGQYANLDMLVAGLITACVLAFVRAVDDGDGDGGSRTRRPGNAAVDDARVNRRWRLAAWALAALAVLAKGLIGLVLPLLIVGPWLLAQRRWRDTAALLHPAGLSVFAVIALPWMVAMQWRFPGFFDYFIVEQHFRRFALAGFNNAQPGWFYGAVLPALTLPWALWLPATLMALRRRGSSPPALASEAFRDQAPSNDASAADASAHRWRLGLCVWWLAVVLGFFSMPASKIVGYALPALAPWCALLSLGVGRSGVALPLDGGPGIGRLNRRARATLAGALLLSLGAVVALTLRPPTNSTRFVARVLAARMAPGDAVVFVDEMFYDLPFYAGLRRPVRVAADWTSPEVPRHDNWRKELFDAARFDPARGAALLWPLSRLHETTCGSQATWFVMRVPSAGRRRGGGDGGDGGGGGGSGSGAGTDSGGGSRSSAGIGTGAGTRNGSGSGSGSGSGGRGDSRGSGSDGGTGTGSGGGGASASIDADVDDSTRTSTLPLASGEARPAPAASSGVPGVPEAVQVHVDGELRLFRAPGRRCSPDASGVSDPVGTPGTPGTPGAPGAPVAPAMR